MKKKNEIANCTCIPIGKIKAIENKKRVLSLISAGSNKR